MAKLQPYHKPIFIIGSARSGTSLTYNTLTKHRDFAYPTREYAIANIGGVSVLKGHYRIYSTNPISRLVLRILSRRLNKQGNRPIEGSRAFFNGLGRSELHRALLTEEDYRPEYERIWRKHIGQIMKMMNKPRFIDKSPAYSFSARFLARMFPEAKFIHIVRDGRAVASSLLELEKKNIVTGVHEKIENSMYLGPS